MHKAQPLRKSRRIEAIEINMVPIEEAKLRDGNSYWVRFMNKRPKEKFPVMAHYTEGKWFYGGGIRGGFTKRKVYAVSDIPVLGPGYRKRMRKAVERLIDDGIEPKIHNIAIRFPPSKHWQRKDIKRYLGASKLKVVNERR